MGACDAALESMESSSLGYSSPPPGPPTMIIGSPPGTLGPVQNAADELTETEIVCTPTQLVTQIAQQAPAPGTPTSASSAQSSSWGGHVGGPSIFDLQQPIMNTNDMLQDLPIWGSPVMGASPGVTSVASMTPEPEVRDQEELALMMQSMDITDAAGSPPTKAPRMD